MIIKEALQEAQIRLKEKNVSEPESSAEFLLRQALTFSRAQLYSNLNNPLSAVAERKYQRYIERRLHHEPVWQIVGKVEFWGLDFFVNHNVLIPRPETEFLVERAMKLIDASDQSLKTSHPSILDVGTGAGPIICAIAHECKSTNLLESVEADFKFQLYASDVSLKALEVAKKNAKNLGMDRKIIFKKSNLLEAWKNQKFDIITANLPYIPHEDLGGLALEIHHYEPRVALDGGKGGLVLYEQFIKELSSHLNIGGFAFCEIGKGQGDRFKKLISKNIADAKCKIIKDLAGFDRIAIVQI